MKDGEITREYIRDIVAQQYPLLSHAEVDSLTDAVMQVPNITETQTATRLLNDIRDIYNIRQLTPEDKELMADGLESGQIEIYDEQGTLDGKELAKEVRKVAVLGPPPAHTYIDPNTPIEGQSTMQKARAMLAMGALLGSVPGSAVQRHKQRQNEDLGVTAEQNELFRGPLRVNPKDGFISAAHHEGGEGRTGYFAFIARPATDEEIAADPERSFYILSRMHTLFDTAEEAKGFGASHLPYVPVLMEDGENFEYPFLIEGPLAQAEERRRKRMLKQHMQAIRTKAGQMQAAQRLAQQNAEFLRQQKGQQRQYNPGDWEHPSLPTPALEMRGLGPVVSEDTVNTLKVMNEVNKHGLRTHLESQFEFNEEDNPPVPIESYAETEDTEGQGT